jgi:hypothetical protein
LQNTTKNIEDFGSKKYKAHRYYGKIIVSTQQLGFYEEADIPKRLPGGWYAEDKETEAPVPAPNKNRWDFEDSDTDTDPWWEASLKHKWIDLGSWSYLGHRRRRVKVPIWAVGWSPSTPYVYLPVD